MGSIGWLKNVVVESKKPKDSIIGVIKKNLAGYSEGRDRSQLHASDITKNDFCPRREALLDLQGVKQTPSFINTALATTFSLGSATARLLIEEWSGDAVVGNWECVICSEIRTMTTKPSGWCGVAKGKKHIWKYNEFSIVAPEYAVSGSIDALFSFGTPYYRVAEIKILSPTEFEKIVVPQPEHRVRTSLYLKLIDESGSVWKSNFNLEEATVLYVSRAYGKANAQWNGEILPFKEFVVSRDDACVKQSLQKAKALKLFREDNSKVPNGICHTAIDKVAQSCSVCKQCFSGEVPAKINWEEQTVK